MSISDYQVKDALATHSEDVDEAVNNFFDRGFHRQNTRRLLNAEAPAD